MAEYLQAEADLKKAHERELKAERTKAIGDPIELSGKVIQMIVRDGDAWTAESGAVARRVSLETGKTKQLYKGHGGPVTCLEFYSPAGASSPFLITGAWDKTIKVWNTETKETISTTLSHDDFIKSLCIIPSLKLLASGSSDKSVRLWDLSVLDSPTTQSTALPQAGSLSGHRRPIDCLAVDLSSPTPLLYSGDSMGVIKSWSLDILTRDDGTRSIRGTVVEEYTGHRTGVCVMAVGEGFVWSGSSDNNILLQPISMSKEQSSFSTSSSPSPPKTATIALSAPVRALLPLHLTPFQQPILLSGSGDLLSVHDIRISPRNETTKGQAGSEVDIDQASKIDAHWHDITGIGYWLRRAQKEDGKPETRELWIVSASLDGTLRKWKLEDLLNKKYETEVQKTLVRAPQPPPPQGSGITLSAEEEAELAALMDDE